MWIFLDLVPIYLLAIPTQIIFLYLVLVDIKRWEISWLLRLDISSSQSLQLLLSKSSISSTWSCFSSAAN